MGAASEASAMALARVLCVTSMDTRTHSQRQQGWRLNGMACMGDTVLEVAKIPSGKRPDDARLAHGYNTTFAYTYARTLTRFDHAAGAQASTGLLTAETEGTITNEALTDGRE